MAQDDELRDLAFRAADALGDDDLERFLTYMHPEVEFTSMIAEMEGETFRGHDGVRRWWATVRDAFEEAVWEYRDIRVAGEHGVARVRIEGRLGGVPVEQAMWQAFRAREGRAVWWAFFRDERDALAAVGFDE